MRYFPILRNATLALHGRAGISTGAIPPNKLFTFSDQDLRAYRDPFTAPTSRSSRRNCAFRLTSDRKVAGVVFVDSGGTRIRGGTQVNSDATITDLNKFTFRSDVGVGVRFDVPQLGLRTIRLDIAKGSQGTHTSFGIGQSF